MDSSAHMERVYTGKLVAFAKDKIHHSTGNPKIAEFYLADGPHEGRFPGCAHPPVHMLTLQLADFPELPAEIIALKTLHVAYTNCSECDPANNLNFSIGEDGNLAPMDDEGVGECSPESSILAKKSKGIVFTADGTDRSLVVVGGLPKWVQSWELWPDCPHCKKRMFYLARITGGVLPPDAEGPCYWLFVFVCAPCRVLNVVSQLLS